MNVAVYFIALAILLGIDMVWLVVVAKSFYAAYLGNLMAKNPNLIAALVFYFLFTAGLLYFSTYPALEKKSWMHALMSGAFFGLVTYATYDLTNLATIKNWPLPLTVVDLLWGTVLSAVVSLLVFLVAGKLGL